MGTCAEALSVNTAYPSLGTLLEEMRSLFPPSLILDLEFFREQAEGSPQDEPF